MNAKQDTLSAGNNITISNNTISGIDPLILQLDGVTQTANTLNFVGNNAVLSGGVLNISRMEWQDALTLRYSTSLTDKDLTQDANGNLLWGTDVLTTNTYLTNSYTNTTTLNILVELCSFSLHCHGFSLERLHSRCAIVLFW